MKFGQIKTIVENNLSGSIKDKKIFKENIKNFKKHFLSDKNLSKLYVLYGDLSKPKSLTEENANIFLNEGISWAKSLLKKSKIPTIKNTINYNDYELIDKLVYDTTNSLEEKMRLLFQLHLVRLNLCYIFTSGLVLFHSRKINSLFSGYSCFS